MVMEFNLVIKRIFSAACYNTGLLELFRNRARRDSAFVLMYHRVLDPLAETHVYVQPGMYVTPKSFRRQMAFLKKKFRIIPLSELMGRVRAGESVSGCCSITFDDGWQDNFDNAFPVLQDLGIPATVFLATAFIGTDRVFWPEEITFYLRQRDVSASMEDRKPLLRLLEEVNGGFGEGRFLEDAVSAMKRWSPESRDELLRELRSTHAAEPALRLLMDWDQIKAMHASGLIEFGSHTANHVMLDQLTLKEAEEEVVQSCSALERHVGNKPVFFAYPNGNYTGEHQVILKRNGFRGAFITRKGWVGKDVNPFEIPRIGVHEDVSCTTPLFFARIVLDGF